LLLAVGIRPSGSGRDHTPMVLLVWLHDALREASSLVRPSDRAHLLEHATVPVDVLGRADREGRSRPTRSRRPRAEHRNRSQKEHRTDTTHPRHRDTLLTAKRHETLGHLGTTAILYALDLRSFNRNSTEKNAKTVTTGNLV
jgi:hypothetical protein